MELSFLNNLSPQLHTFFLAMLPIGETRVAIPVALENFHLPIWQAFTFSVLGSFVPAILIIYFIGPVSAWLIRNFKTAAKFFNWLFDRTRKKFAGKYETWGKLALMIFVAIPLPATGVWTGSLAAWLFAIDKKSSLIYIGLGTFISGIIVTIITLGIKNIFNLI
ncbi:ligand-binding protein SH3 [Candidatus Parcubacteria bacterium]|nr:MAG: ligand-binding protein SH3 [Candidatus Parcubacteria bacterium]